MTPERINTHRRNLAKKLRRIYKQDSHDQRLSPQKRKRARGKVPANARVDSIEVDSTGMRIILKLPVSMRQHTQAITADVMNPKPKVLLRDKSANPATSKSRRKILALNGPKTPVFEPRVDVQPQQAKQRTRQAVCGGGLYVRLPGTKVCGFHPQEVLPRDEARRTPAVGTTPGGAAGGAGDAAGADRLRLLVGLLRSRHVA